MGEGTLSLELTNRTTSQEQEGLQGPIATDPPGLEDNSTDDVTMAPARSPSRWSERTPSEIRDIPTDSDEPGPREGLGGPPQIGAESLFSSYPVSGWVKDGEFHDPRRLPYGPMSAAMGKYRGLYRSAKGTVLSYEVAGVGILDLPGMERGEGVGVFTRSVEVGKAAHSLSMMVCSVAGFSTATVFSSTGSTHWPSM